MNPNDEFLEKNRRRWDELAEIHPKSKYYDLENFTKGTSSLEKLDLELIGDLTGKRVLHLQCHFGMDSISLWRHGAAEVVGVDFSEKAIKQAKKLAKQIGANVRFIQSDVLQLDEVFDEYHSFDLVYTSYGTITWLPDLEKWGEIISKFLRPDGCLVFVDSHPFASVFDDEVENAQLIPIYPYSTKGEALHFHVEGSYATGENIENKDEYLWQYSLSEIINSLTAQEMIIQNIGEYTTINWKSFPFLVENESGWYEYPDDFTQTKVPLLLSITAKKNPNVTY